MANMLGLDSAADDIIRSVVGDVKLTCPEESARLQIAVAADKEGAENAWILAGVLRIWGLSAEISVLGGGPAIPDRILQADILLIDLESGFAPLLGVEWVLEGLRRIDAPCTIASISAHYSEIESRYGLKAFRFGDWVLQDGKPETLREFIEFMDTVLVKHLYPDRQPAPP